jgi:ubiquinone/menaquinone biosynthesis C-methylase UbiE
MVCARLEALLCDIVDMRHALAQSLPFYLVRNDVLPFRGKSFDSTYIQYVLRHVSTLTEIIRLLAEALRVSDRVIIVEEIKGDKTDVASAETFDKKMNAKLH